MIASKHSFRLLSTDKTTNTNPVKSEKKVQSSDNLESDSKKRSFLKLAGVVGVGAIAASLIPKKAEALVFGSTPTSNTVGLKNAANSRVNPATEDGNLAAIKIDVDKIPADPAREGGNLATIAAKDFATQTTLATRASEATLALIKANSDKFTFDGSNNLLTASAGGAASTVGIKDKTDTQINPVTEDAIIYLRRMVKIMESQATVDVANRQRITLDALGAIGATMPVSGTVTATVSSAAISTMAGQNQQMFQDVARNSYANGIRQNLIFS